MKTKRTLRWVAWLMAFCMILNGIPANTLQALAAGDTEEKVAFADVYLLWADPTSDETMAATMVISETQPEGLELIGKYVTDGVYLPDDGDENLLLALNNAHIYALGLDELPEGWALSGNTDVDLSQITVSSDANLFPAYDDVIDAGLLMEFYNSDIYDEYAYDWTIRGNYTIIGFAWAREVVIRQGAILTLGTFVDDEDEATGMTSGSYLNVAALEVSGQLNFLQPDRNDRPSGVDIHGDLFMGANGVINGYNGALIAFEEGANSEFTFYRHDGSVYDEFPAQDLVDFYCEDDGNWYLAEDYVFPVPEGQFRLEYANDDDNDVPLNAVYVGDEFCRGDQNYEFEPGVPLNFTLVPRQENLTENLYVEIEVDGGLWYSNFAEEDENKLVIENYSFSYTPETSAGFYVRIWWNDYERFCGDWDTEYTLEVNSGDGAISVSPEVANANMMMQHPFEPRRSRRIYNKSVKELTFTLTPDDGRQLYDISLWIEGTEYHYKTRDFDEDDMPLDADHGFAEADGVYTFTATIPAGTNWVSIWAFFEDVNSGFHVEDNTYRVDYDEWFDWETQTNLGWVTVNEDIIRSRVDQEFTEKVELDFVLHQPEPRAIETPIVHINSGRYHYSNDPTDVDAAHLIELVKNGDLYTFSFTPPSVDGFEVMVWWSTYDCFGPTGDEFCISTHYNGDGDITVTPNAPGYMHEPGEGFTGEKYIYPKSFFTNGGKVTLKFEPEDGNCVGRISVWYNGVGTNYMLNPPEDNSPYVSLLDPNNGLTYDDGTYYLELTGLPGDDNWYNIDVDFWTVFGVDDDLTTNQYRINYDECYDSWANEMHAWVMVGEDVIRDGAANSFVANTELTFLLHPHESRIGCTPIVWINLKNGQSYSNRVNEGTYLLNLETVGDDYTFSYTPTSDKPFQVMIWWSDYDCYQHDGNTEFVLDTCHGGDGTITTDLAPKFSMTEPGETTTGVRMTFENAIFNNGGTLKIGFVPAENNYLFKVNLHSVNKTYSTYIPEEGEDCEYILSENSGFVLEDGIYYLVLTSVPQNDWFSIDAEFREKAKGINFTTFGDATVEYKVGGMPEFSEISPDEDENIVLLRAIYENFDSVQIHFVPRDENVRMNGVRINYNDRAGRWQEHCIPLDQNNCFTLTKVNGEWPDYEITLITWDNYPLDWQYLIEPRGEGEVSLNGDLEFNTIYSFAQGDTISFDVIGEHYRVVAEINNMPWPEMYNEDGHYELETQSYNGVRFVVYVTKAHYDYDHLQPDYDNGEFTVEYCMRTDEAVNFEGGSLSFDDDLEIIDSKSSGDRTRMIVRNTQLIHVTIEPIAGFTYYAYYEGRDITEEVKANENVFLWDVSEPQMISSLDVFFVFDRSEAAIMSTAVGAFDGKIGIVYYFFLPEWLQYDENAYVTYEEDGNVTTKLLSGIFAAGVDQDGRYRFAYYMPAAHYRENVTLRLYEGNGNPVTIRGGSGTDYTGSGITYSLKRYVDSIKKSSDPKVKRLGQAMDDYCTAAQINFGYKVDENCQLSSAVEEVTRDELKDYKSIRVGNLPTSITTLSLQASFAADNTLKIGVIFKKNKPKNVKYYIDGREVSLKGSKANGYYLAVRNIPAAEIGKPHEFVITDGSADHTLSLTCSLYTYANAMAFQTGDMNIRALVRACYLYGEAAKDYFDVTY